MIKHIVFFKLPEQAEGKNKQELISYIKSELENLINLIPQIQKIEIGVNAPGAPDGNFDISLYSEFENMDDMYIYQNHPEHVRVASFIKKVMIAKAAVDYPV